MESHSPAAAPLLRSASSAADPAWWMPALGRMMSTGRYRRCISLGSHCQTAYQIRRSFCQEEAYFFDWLGTPAPALIELLRTGMMRLFKDKAEFVPNPVPLNEGRPIRHAALGVIVAHEHHFAQRSEGDDFATMVARYTFLATRWDATIKAGGPLLFVRHIVDRAEASAISDTIAACYPGLDFSLLAISENPADIEPWRLPRVINAVVGRTPFDAIEGGTAGPDDWQGDTEGWGRAFQLAKALE